MERDKRWREAVIRLLVATQRDIEGSSHRRASWGEGRGLRRLRQPLEQAPWRDRWPDRPAVGRGTRARAH